MRLIAVHRTMKALEVLVRRPVSTNELAHILMTDGRSARRILLSLKADGYVVQGGGHRKRYRISAGGRALAARMLVAPEDVPADAPRAAHRRPSAPDPAEDWERVLLELAAGGRWGRYEVTASDAAPSG